MVIQTKNVHTGNTCPIAKVADLLSDSWTMLIIRDLLRAPSRFSELERSLDGISSRTLTLKLKKLVAEKIITKNEQTKFYSVTKQGKNLGEILEAMRGYGKKWL